MQARGPYYALFRQQGRSSSGSSPAPLSPSVAFAAARGVDQDIPPLD